MDVWRHAELVSAGVRAVHGIVTAKSWRYSTRLAVGRQTDRQKTSRLATLRVVPDLFHIIPFERHHDGDNSQDDEDNDTASNQVALCEAAAYFVLTPHITETLLQAPRVRIILLRSGSARRQGTRETTLMRQRRPHAGTVLYSAHAGMRRARTDSEYWSIIWIAVSSTSSSELTSSSLVCAFFVVCFSFWARMAFKPPGFGVFFLPMLPTPSS